MKKVGIMGGTFDPIHYGHLAIAEAAGHEFGLEKVIFIPAGNPPHKKSYQVTEAADRFAMVEMAIAGNSKFTISAIELERKGPSYTVDTVTQLKDLYPDTQFFMITGADAIVEILTWKDAPGLAQMCNFIAATRPGYDISRLDREISTFPEEIRQKIFTIPVPGIAVSSTEIRERIAAGKPIKYLLPEEVEKYILQKKIFHEKKKNFQKS